jgi:hypothetical protein
MTGRCPAGQQRHRLEKTVKVVKTAKAEGASLLAKGGAEANPSGLVGPDSR